MSSIPAGLFLAIALGLRAPVQVQTAADAVTLRDGAVVLGVLAESPKGAGLALYLRREWVRKAAKDWARKWETAEAPAARRAQSQRVARLTAWRRERAGTVEKADDPVLAWVDGELARLKDPDAWKSSTLVLVRPARDEIKSVRRAPGEGPPLLRLAWTSGLPDPEDLRLPDLKEALTGRGFDLSVSKPVSLDRLLPPPTETDAAWTLRRAATEVSADSGLRFLRYQGLVLAEPAVAQPAELPDLDLTAGLGALKQLLGEDTGDPLPAKLREVSARGRVGATVTRLEIAEDFSAVAVEITLWVRQGPERWVPSGSRTNRVRPDDLAADAGKDLAKDPQVGAAFRFVEALGLGRVSPELKRRSLNVGAATRKALGQARTDAGADLAALAFPIESGRGDGPLEAEGR